jgi:hypothetical protein
MKVKVKEKAKRETSKASFLLGLLFSSEDGGLMLL